MNSHTSNHTSKREFHLASNPTRTFSPSLSSSLFCLFFIVNSYIKAYAQTIDTLLFETNVSLNNTAPTTRFKFTSPTTLSSPGTSSSLLFVEAKNAINNGKCNLIPGVSESPPAWQLVKKWSSAIAGGTLEVGSPDKNNSDPITCVTNLINQLAQSEIKMFDSYIVPAIISFFLLAAIGIGVFTFTLANKNSCPKNNLSPAQIMNRFRDYFRKNKNEDTPIHSILLDPLKKESERTANYSSIV